jgi:diapolycopene oxygenase
MAETLKIGVIGGGLGGLASACVLAARGHKVTLLEKNAWFGGKAAVLEEQGYRFDMGPTILTIPSVLKRIFAEAGKNVDDYLDLVYLDPQWRCFFEDHTVLDLEANVDKMAKRLDTYTQGTASGEGYKKFIDFSERMNAISDRFFFWKSIGGIKDMFQFKSSFQPKVLGDVLSMRMGFSVGGTVRKYVPNPNVAQMLDHFTQYVGSAPDMSPAVLCGIAAMQTGEGVWYPKGGTRAVPAALTKLAGELGVDMRNNVEILTIETDASKKKVTGIVAASGEKYTFDRVVSNSDSVRTHTELLKGTPKVAAFENRREYEPACSGVVLYLGLNRRYDQLLHHNFVFSKDPHQEFEQIYREGVPAEDPTAYLCAPAITEPSVAPPGGEALYILVHTPYLRDKHDWAKMLPAYRKTILKKLETCAGMEDIEKHIVYESALTPQSIHDRYRVLNGAIYGLASHGKWAGAFKPANRSPDYEGLYLAGGSAHPGPGMPAVPPGQRPNAMSWQRKRKFRTKTVAELVIIPWAGT